MGNEATMSGCRVAEDMFAVSQSGDHSPGWGRVTLKSVGMDVDMDVDMDMDTNSIQTESPNTDFYETLNVSRTATTAEIKNAYHRLCLVFHPDKQLDPTLKSSTQRVFQTIHTAYTVLSNATQREIYDRHGMEGIEAAWQLGPHLSQSDKLLEEIQRQRARLFGGDIVNSKTAFTVGLDLREMMDDIVETDSLVYSDLLPKVSAVGVTEVLETALDQDNQLTATVTTVCQSGNVGSGTVTLNWRRPFILSGLQLDAGVGFGTRKHLSSALVYQLDKFTTTSLQMVGVLRGGAVFPQLSYSISRMLNDRVVGSLQYANDLVSGNAQLVLSVSTKTAPDVKSPLTVSVHLPSITPRSAFVEAKKTILLSDRNECRIKIGASEQGGSVHLAVHHTWNKKTRGSAALQLDSGAGVSLRLGITHGSLHLIVPVHFSQELSPAAIVLASLLPTIGTLVSRTWIHPFLKRRHSERFWTEYTRKRAAMIERKREEAALTVELMALAVDKRQTGDLRIIEAIYRACDDHALAWSVTVPLQFLVNDGQIRLDPAYRANVLGFFDVAIGRRKETLVTYEFRGRLHRAVFRDDEELLIPLRTHLQ